MKKLLGLLLLWACLGLIVSLLVSINFFFGLLQPDKIKSLGRESSIYDFLAADFREQVVADDSLDIKNTPVLEIITEAISAKTIQQVFEQSIDNFFAAVDNPGQNTAIVIPFSLINQEISQAIAKTAGADNAGISISVEQDQRIEIGQSATMNALGRRKQFLIGQAAAVLVLLTLLFILPAKTASGRLIWVGLPIFLAGLSFAVTAALAYFAFPAIVSYLAEYLPANDAKTAMGIERLLSLIVAQQRLYLLIEAVVLLLLGSLIFGVSRSFREVKIEIPSGSGRDSVPLK
ncbi:MAG: hypothetical protein AAB360_03980 [Patescibacteria group bacterium]